MFLRYLLAFSLAFGLAFGFAATARASHVIPGVMITAAQYCETIEGADNAQALFAGSDDEEGRQAYFDFINSKESDCWDTRVWDMAAKGFLPVSKVEGHPVRISDHPFGDKKAEYILWEFWWDGETVYIWEIHPTDDAI